MEGVFQARQHLGRIGVGQGEAVLARGDGRQVEVLDRPDLVADLAPDLVELDGLDIQAEGPERVDVAVAQARPVANSMPSLKVARVARMNSRSSIPSMALKVRIGGMVASPTPTVPICSDSISTTSTWPPSTLDRAAAVIQPAVPPPRTRTLRTGWEDGSWAVLQGVGVQRHGLGGLADQAAQPGQGRVGLVGGQAVGQRS
jgi:hypothetical protein